MYFIKKYREKIKYEKDIDSSMMSYCIIKTEDKNTNKNL